MVSAAGLGEHGRLLWVAMITSAENQSWPDDRSLGPAYQDAGLPAPSVIRACKLATIETDHADHLGRIAPDLMAEVLVTIRGSMGLA